MGSLMLCACFSCRRGACWFWRGGLLYGGGVELASWRGWMGTGVPVAWSPFICGRGSVVGGSGVGGGDLRDCVEAG
jgi:hypothetical protein